MAEKKVDAMVVRNVTNYELVFEFIRRTREDKELWALVSTNQLRIIRNAAIDEMDKRYIRVIK